MKNLFTRFLMIVFLFSVFYQAYAAGAPPAPPVTSVNTLWPEDESTTQAQPGTNVLVLEFSKDLNATQPFGPDGVFGLIWESQSLGYQQKESILYKVDGASKITKVGTRKVEIRFAESLLEDEIYHVTIEDDAIRFADGSYFGGISYSNPGNPADPNPEWRFTVDDVTAPLMTNCGDGNNVNGKFNVSVDQNPITVCFNEPVWWAAGADPMKIGNIAFYTAAKAGLDPNTEFGGDVIYEKPADVILYNDGVEVYNTMTVKSASVTVIPSFDRVEIYPKETNGNDLLKHAAIGNHVWPADRDMYLRFAAGLLVDKGGNPFGGIDGSPYDVYTVGGNSQYWFSTRTDQGITKSAWAVLNTATLPGTGRGSGNKLWENDDIVVKIMSNDLEFVDNTPITATNVNQFIKLYDGTTPVSYTVKQINENVAGGYTEYLLEPGNLPHKKVLKVDLLGGVIRDNGDLRVVTAGSWNFNTGDYLPPAYTSTTNNILCTNFDIRVTSNEVGTVYYAIWKYMAPASGWPAFANGTMPTAEEILKGQVKRTVGTHPNKYDYYWHFYHVDDAGVFGKTGVDTRLKWISETVPPADPAPLVTGWTRDEYNINASLTAFEHVDDFTLPNHGDTYYVYQFALDPNAQGPYNNPAGIPNGRITAVTNPSPTNPVKLSDCLEPELIWWFDDIKRPNYGDDLWDACPVDSLIKKQGKFKLDFAPGAQPDPIKLVNSSLTWMDVLKLEVQEYGSTTWNEVEIASAVPSPATGLVLNVTVTPLNNYPSQGKVRITLLSGTVEDASGNAINTALVCEKNVEVYNDPWVHVFTVENEDLMFPAEHPEMNGVRANKDGKITIIFNNPMYSPERDSPNPQATTLLPISLDPAAVNYVGNYVKLREGDSNGAEVTDDIATHIPLSFELYNAAGVKINAPVTTGVVKIVATPTVNYNSETWYYVELEKDLRDENLRELSYTNGLGTWDNNLFVDIHQQYAPYPTANMGNPPYAEIGNSAHYFMRFKSEDTVSPELRFVFEKVVENWPETPNPDDRIFPYIEEVDSAFVSCIDPLGFEDNEIPVGAVITEWSKMGFDNKDYYVTTDPNGLRPYFKMKDANGFELNFDVVVLNIYPPDAQGESPYYKDAVWFGFVPFETLAEGEMYSMEFDPNYQAPQEGQISSLPEGPVFVDDNGNPLVKNTLVEFATCGEEPACFDVFPATKTTTDIDGKNVAQSLKPSFTITVENGDYTIYGGVWFSYTTTMVITDGVKSWYTNQPYLFKYNGNTVTIPWEAFTGPAPMLDEKTQYEIIVPEYAFVDKNNEYYYSCASADTSFWSPDLTAPVANAYSPDIDNFALNTDVGNAANDDPKEIDPRNPGKLSISWNEKVLPQAGKVIEVWENGTTKRLTFTYSATNANMKWIAESNTMEVTLPADFFAYYSVSPARGHFHVDVQAGMVKDMAGNASAHLTGPQDRMPAGGSTNGSATWTFQTGVNVSPVITTYSPICLVEPGTMNTQVVAGGDVQVNEISLTMSEGVVPVAGKKMYLRKYSGGTDIYVTDVTAMTASADKKTYKIAPMVNGQPLVLPFMSEEATTGGYQIFVYEGAFVESYPANSSNGIPNYEVENLLDCSYSGSEVVFVEGSFAFGDLKAPEATIWPLDKDVKVPFNAHGYVKFSEQIIARAGYSPIDPQLVLTQNNIKNWIKVLKADTDGSGNPLGTYSNLPTSDYVVEFVNLERTHVRITFLDEKAPAIEGVTANMQDEWNYKIVVNTNANIGGVDYYLQDMAGSLLGMPSGASSGDYTDDNLTKQVTFTTEDITVPKFYVSTSDVTNQSIKINFSQWVNVNPYSSTPARTYAKEKGKAYYIVQPAAQTAPTAAQLYDAAWRTANGAKWIDVPVAGASATWTFATDINLTTDYDYVVYSVMQDDESDVYVAPTYGDAWPTMDAVFIASGDANPATGAIGLADIRPAPNKNQSVMNWNFCFCDDDAPIVATKPAATTPANWYNMWKTTGLEAKEWNMEINVPVDETFAIGFDELIKAGDKVILSGIGTGGTVMTPEYGYEVRLREWNNNVAVPITLRGNGTGTYGEVGATGFIIDPVAELLEETRYYIEIDRWVVWDQAGSNCAGTVNTLPDGYPVVPSVACSYDEYANNFEGWIGREEWWFQTTDNTPPVLTAVSPLGDCVSVDNNKVVFTFQEKNELLIATLAGQSNNVYIYKVGSTVPYEIVSAQSGVKVRGTGNTWTVTYTTTHPYNSEEEYYVLWDKKLFVDNAVPVKHPYTLHEDLDGVVINYPANTAWHQFGFTTEDAMLPVADWSFVNRMWVGEYGSEYVYSLANGSYNSNDILAEPVNVCAMYADGVPQEVGMYVWFNEPVELTDVAATPANTYMRRWINANFKLTTTAGAHVELDYLGMGVAGAGGMTIPGGVIIPAGKQWYYMKPYMNLNSLGTYDFAVKGNAVTDMLEEGEDEDCRTNTLDETKLFNFCVWDATPPTAELYDGKDAIVLDDDNIMVEDKCVAERDYFKLVFSSELVKTINVTVPPQFGNPVPPAWWTYSNLKLTEADLKDTDGDPIFRFQNMETDEYVKIIKVDISADGKEFKLWVEKPLDSEGHYEYEILPNKLKDQKRVPNGNFYAGNVWEFQVTDTEAPEITSITPADGAVNVNPMEALEIVFNEDVVLGSGERIIIRDNGNADGVIYNFRADDSDHVTLMDDEQTVVINHEGLDKNTTYYVQVEPGFVYEENCSNLPFAGSSEQMLIDGDWNFTTGDSDGPVASLLPVPGDGCVEIDAELVIRFDENVVLTDDGRVVIYKVKEDGSFHNPLWPNAMFGDVVAVIPFTSTNYPQVRLSGSDAANGLTKDIITITPPEGVWESGASYYVRIVGNGIDEATEASVVEDVIGNTWKYPVSHPSLDLLPGIHQNQWYFTIGNNDEPVLASVTPEWGDDVAAGVASATTDLTMTFEDEIKFGSGTIQVWEFIETPQGGVAAQQAHPWMVYNIPADVTSGKISMSGNTVTVHDVKLLDGIHWYYVLVSPGAITNNVECTLRGWSGISNPDEWLFSTDPDVTDPSLTASSVTSDACSPMYLEPASVAFELTFSEDVSVARGTGTVQIVEGTTVVATATITPAKIAGNVIKLSASDFSAPLMDGKDYKMVVGGNAIHDEATASLTMTQNPFGKVPVGNENWFAGVEIPFKTGDFTAPVAVAFSPNGMMYLENSVKMVVTFSEPVQPGTGKLKLFNAATDGLVAEFMASADEDTNPLTVTLSKMLVDETAYYVLIEEGFVTDMIYMESCDEVRGNVAVTSESDWTFGIDDNTVPAIVADLTVGADNLMKAFDVVLKYNDVITEVDLSKAQLMLDGYAVGGAWKAVIGTDPTEVIVSILAAEDQETYMLDLAAGFAKDDANTANASLAAVTGPYMVGDRTNPILEAAAPSGILDSYIGVEVKVDFFDDSALTVKKAIEIKDASGVVVETWIPELDANQAASFMPNLWFGNYTVVIPAGAVEDVNGNIYAGTTWSFAIIDDVAPDDDCMTIISPADGANCVKNSIDLKLEFCERMAAGNPAKLVKVYNILEVGGGLSENVLFKSFPVTAAMVNGTMVTMPLSGLVDNTSYTVMMDAGALTDEAGNSFVGINDPIRWNFTTGDNTAPTAMLVPVGSENNKNQFVVNAVFSEPVVGAATMIMVEGATSSTVTESATDNKVYEIAMTAADKATVTITVPVTITDVNCNNNPLASEVKGTFVVGDNTAPTVAVTSAPADAMNTLNMFNVELTFSEKVNGVTAALAGSVGMTGVTTTDNVVYTVAFAGADETSGKLVLDKNLVTDDSQNANKLAEGIMWDYMVGDHAVPTALVAPTMGTDLRVQKLDVVVTFSEAVIVPAGGIVVTGGVGTVTSTGNVYNVAITAADGATVKLNLTSLITDDSKNANKLAAAEYSYSFGDRTAPMVTVYKPGATDTIPTFDVTIGFNEKVTGVSASSVTLTGTGAVMTLRTIVDGWAYEATITGAQQSDLVLGFSNAIKDMSGNSIVPVTFNYSIGDFTAPTVMANPATGNFVTNMFEVTLTFDEDVTGVAGAVSVSSGTVAVTGSGKVYVAKVNAPSLSTVELSLGTAIKDAAGNKFAGAAFSYNVTGIVPITTIQNTPLEGTKLQINGTVTAIAAGEGFFVQDASAAWSGIWVEYFNVGEANIKIGDGVLVTGEVSEIGAVTSVIASAVAKDGIGKTINPLVVMPTDAKAEKYESVLVTVEGARVTAADAGSGEWKIYYETTDYIMVNDWLYKSTPVADKFYDVIGIVNGRLDAFKMEPRMESDVKLLTGVDPVLSIDFKVYPNPFSEYIQIDNNDKLARVVILNIAGQKVIDIEYPENRIRTANLVSGVYLVNLFTEEGIVKTERIIKR